MSNVVSVLAVIKFLGATSGVARAQATGTISGIVTDESGASIPGVTIEVTNAGTNQTRTGATGTYTVFQVPPGPYVVKAVLPGFKVVVRDGITVTVESTVRVDIRMSVGGLEESVTVTADSPLVETRSATLGIVIEERTIAELPLNDRNFTQLGTLMPGVVAPAAALGGAPGEATPGGFGAVTSGFSVNSMCNQSNNFLLDGASNNDPFNTGFVLRPPPDAIHESNAHRIQLHIEAFNAFNQNRFGQPGNQIGTGNFGRITSAEDGRIVQLAVKYSF